MREIRTVDTRFGTLHAVAGTKMAFATREQAEKFAVNHRFLEAKKQLAAAASEMLEAWSAVELLDGSEVDCTLYPFKLSLDEQVYAIYEWLGHEKVTTKD
jgi:hypothetical protein